MNEIIFSGYFAEVIALRAERKGVTPQEYILSFFEPRCNAPDGGSDFVLSEGAMHPAS